jgi:Spy/CpxP family protein refolding chaperone
LQEDPTAAVVISQQIVIRFAEQLTPEQRKQLGIDQEIELEETIEP